MKLLVWKCVSLDLSDMTNFNIIYALRNKKQESLSRVTWKRYRGLDAEVKWDLISILMSSLDSPKPYYYYYF